MDSNEELPNFDFKFVLLEDDDTEHEAKDAEPPKRKRFADGGRAEVSNILQEAQSKNTHYSTKWAISIIEGKMQLICKEEELTLPSI